MKKQYSNTYTIEPRKATYEQIKEILEGYSILNQEGKEGKTHYLLPRNIKVTAFSSSGNTILWITRDFKRLPKEIKIFLEATNANRGSSGFQSLESLLKFEMRQHLDLNKIGSTAASLIKY